MKLRAFERCTECGRHDRVINHSTQPCPPHECSVLLCERCTRAALVMFQPKGGDLHEGQQKERRQRERRRQENAVLAPAPAVAKAAPAPAVAKAAPAGVIEVVIPARVLHGSDWDVQRTVFDTLRDYGVPVVSCSVGAATGTPTIVVKRGVLSERRDILSGGLVYQWQP